MAKDKKRGSGSKPVNSSELSLTNELIRIGQSEETLAARQARNQLEEDYKFLEVIRGYPNEVIQADPKTAAQLAQVTARIPKLEQTLETMNTAKQARRTRQARGKIERFYSESHISGTVNGLTRTASAQEAGYGMATSMSPRDIESQVSTVMGRINELGTSSLEGTGGLYGAGGTNQSTVEKMSRNEAEARKLFSELANLKSAQKMQSQMGMDVKGTLTDRMRAYSTAQSIVNRESLKSEMQQGFISIPHVDEKGTQGSRSVYTADFKQEEIKLAKELLDIEKKLAKEKDKSSDAFKKLSDQANATSEGLQKVQTAIGSGGGGGKAGRYLDKYGNYMEAGLQVLGAASSGIRNIGINQSMIERTNIAGFAAIENQKYETYKAARGGDVLSQMMLSQFGNAEAFGSRMEIAQNTATTFDAMGALGNVALSGLKGAAGGFLLGGPAGAVLGAVGGAAYGVADVATNVSDLARGTSGNQTQIAATQTQLAAAREVMKIKAEQLQTYRDFSVGAGVVAQGMGRGAEAFLTEVTSVNAKPGEKLFTQRLAEARMSPEQFNQMAQMGVQNMGSAFKTDQVFAARNLEATGFGSMQQNIARMSQLAQVGSNNPQKGLESVLENAVSKGMDSSKAIDMMVQYTGSIAQQSGASAALGLDTTGAAARVLAAGVDTTIPNKEFALERAATAREFMQDIRSNAGVSFSGMVNTSRISNKLGVSSTEAIALQQLNDADVSSLVSLSKDPNNEKKLRDFYLQKGVDVRGKSFKDLQNMSTGLEEAKFMSGLELGGAGFAMMSTRSRELLFKNRENLDTLSKDPNNIKDKDLQTAIIEYNAAMSVRSGGKLTGREGLLGNQANSLESKSDVVSDAFKGKGGSELLKSLDELRTSGFKQLSEQATQAQEAMQKFGGALKNLVDLNKELEQRGTAGAEKEFSEAGAKAAGSFGEHVTTFGTDVEAFGSAVDRLIEKANLSVERRTSSSDSRTTKSGPKRD